MHLRILLPIFLLFTVACAKGYKEGEPLTGEQMALAQKATQLAQRVERFSEKVPSSIEENWEPFVENVRSFDNACQRSGCNSLEARNEFNHLRYFAVQLDFLITQNEHPKLYPEWKEIREEYVDSIGKELGYRIE
jgi:hypothetical protein